MTMPAPAEGTALASADWLAAHLGEPGLVVVDATVVMPAPRHDGDYRAESGRPRWQEARIPGARFADLLEEFADTTAPYHYALPAPAALAHAFAGLGINDGDRLVVYDSESGYWAARLWWMARWIGMDARVLDGGWRAWLAARGPVAGGAADAPAPGRVTPSVRAGYWAAREEVLGSVRGETAATLLYALSADAYAGRVPTRYARRGHIPGSRLLPAQSLFDADGRYLTADLLRHRLAALLDDAPRPLVAYCGGGISAAAVALALTELGEPAVRIYDGSLEEWASDPTLPLTTDPER